MPRNLLRPPAAARRPHAYIDPAQDGPVFRSQIDACRAHRSLADWRHSYLPARPAGRSSFAGVDFDVVLPRHDESEALRKGCVQSRVAWHFAPYDYGKSLYKVAMGVINRSRFDVLHSHGVTAGVISAGAMLLRRPPHLLTPHETLNAADFQGRAGQVKHAVLGAALSRVDAIHCLTDQARDNLFQYFSA